MVDAGTEPEKLVSVLDSTAIHPSLNDLLKQPDRAISMEGPGGCRFLGFQLKLGELDQLSQVEREILFEILGMEEGQADILLLNLHLNMDQSDLFSYIQSLDEAVLVVSPQDLQGSYRILKALYSIRPDLRVDLVECGASLSTNRKGVHQLVFASRRFLQRSPAVLGSVPVDEFRAANGVSRVSDRESPQHRAMTEIAKIILEDSSRPEGFDRGLFFEQIQTRWNHESKSGEEERVP